jgi:hypothetical protein
VTRAEFIFQACERSDVTFSRHVRVHTAAIFQSFAEHSDRSGVSGVGTDPVMLFVTEAHLQSYARGTVAQAKDCRAQILGKERDPPQRFSISAR